MPKELIKFEDIIDYLEERIKFHKDNYKNLKCEKSFSVLHEFEIFLNHFYMNLIMDKNIRIDNDSKFAKLRKELSEYYNNEIEKKFPIKKRIE